LREDHKNQLVVFDLPEADSCEHAKKQDTVVSDIVSMKDEYGTLEYKYGKAKEFEEEFLNVLRLWQDSQSKNIMNDEVSNYIDNILAINSDLLAEKSILEQENDFLVSDFESMKEKYGTLEYKFGKAKKVEEEFQTKIRELQEGNHHRNDTIRQLMNKTKELLDEKSENSKYFEEVVLKATMVISWHKAQSCRNFPI
jgi:hypothetical protein